LKIFAVEIYAFAAPASADESVVVVYDVPAQNLTPQDILESWPICDFPSSLGQICRAYWEQKRPKGIYEVLVNGSVEGADQSIIFEISETVLKI
jgi:hypothetical protein